MPLNEALSYLDSTINKTLEPGIKLLVSINDVILEDLMKILHSDMIKILHNDVVN